MPQCKFLKETNRIVSGIENEDMVGGVMEAADADTDRAKLAKLLKKKYRSVKKN